MLAAVLPSNVFEVLITGALGPGEELLDRLAWRQRQFTDYWSSNLRLEKFRFLDGTPNFR